MEESEKYHDGDWDRSSIRALAKDTLDALTGAIPGLSDVLDGKAVIVPTTATHEMLVMARQLDALGCDVEDHSLEPVYAKAWIGYLLDNPYRKEPTP